MSIQEDFIKQKNWNDLKSAVGTMAEQTKTGKGTMSLDDLLLNIKDVSFDAFVCQSMIQTAEDKELFRTKGYAVSLTEDEFKQQFRVDPACIWYTPSFAQNCLYFNPDTLAAAPFPIQLYEAGVYKDTNMLHKAIQSREAEVAKNDFMGSILTFPDVARMEYFDFLVEKKGNDLPELYDLFCSIYIDNDYGFGKIKPETLQAILDAKTEENRKQTIEKLRDYP